MKTKRALLASNLLFLLITACLLILFLLPETDADITELSDNGADIMENDTDVTTADNVQGYSSDLSADVLYTYKNTSYIVANITAIYVNTATQTVATYDDDGALIRAFLCSTGEETPEGIFGLGNKYDWLALYDDCYGQYAYRLTGDDSVAHILFHSVPYYENSKDSLEWEEYNNLGEAVSAGCIRLDVANAKWIYENATSDTEVVIYSEASENITPEESCFIPEILTDLRGWDPTDPDEENPWLDYIFTLEMPYSIFIDDEDDTMSYISAIDYYGNDLSDYVKISCEEPQYYLSVPGTYVVSVSLSIGLVTATGSINVTVS